MHHSSPGRGIALQPATTTSNGMARTKAMVLAAQAAARGATGADFIEASVIDARLRQLVAQRRLMQLEARDARGGRPSPDELPPQ